MIVSQTAILGIACSALISFAAPFVVYLVCRRRMTVSLRNVGLGAATFVLFALVLEGLMHFYVLKLNPATAAWMKTHAWGFVAYGAGAAAVYEETGRYLAMRLFAKRTGNPGTAVAYGIGHGGTESLIVGALAQLQAIFLAMMLNLGKLDAVIGHKLPAAALAKLHANLAHLDFAHALMGGIERVCALLLQIALSLLVWRAVSQRQALWFLAALAAHAAIDTFAAMAQRGLLPVIVTERIVWAVGLALLTFFLIKLPRRQA